MATNNATNTSNPAVVADGGTGSASTTAYALICGGTTTTGAFQAVADVATGQVLTSGGTAALPVFSATPTVTGITFGSGTQLSTYSEGTFTPTMVGASTAGSTTYSVQVGYYRRIGNLAFIQFAVTGTAATGTGNALIGAFPFTIKNTSNGNVYGAMLMANNLAWTWPAGTTSAAMNGLINSTTAIIQISGTGAGLGALQMQNAAFNMQSSFCYGI